MGIRYGFDYVDPVCTAVSEVRWGPPQRSIPPRARTARPPRSAEAPTVQRLVVPGRPWGLNAERSKHWTQHRARTQTFREAAGWVAMQHLSPVDFVDIVVECRMRPPLLDTGSNYPAVKAMIDGLVDVGILKDDTPRYVRSVKLLAPFAVRSNEPETTTLVLLTVEREN